MPNEKRLRIGELARRSGVSPELLRAWERRYGLLRPVRSPGGLRLYSLDDLERVRRMRAHVAEGIAAAEAAVLAVAETPEREPERGTLRPDAARAELAAALDALDEPRAQTVFDSVLAQATLDTLLSAIVLPYLHDLGERWERGDVSIAHEHFASNVLRGRLLGLARGWGRGLGPRVLLACPPHEQHDLGLISFGLATRARGWQVEYLGADTPVETLLGAARLLDPALVVLSAVTVDRFRPVAAGLNMISAHYRLALGGAGAADAGPDELGALALTDDPVTEAERVTALVPATASGALRGPGVDAA